MSKRGATSYLTHDNWNDEDEESEEPGVFTAASHAVLEKREIRKAKRRSVPAEKEGSGGAFQGFSFTGSNGQPSIASAVGKPFSFVVDSSKISVSISESGTSLGSTTSTISSASASTSRTCMSTTKLADDEESESEYRRNLRNLNESVLTWIGDHITRNPYCILSPIFSDYERYIVELDKEYPYSSNSNLVEDTEPTNTSAGISFAFVSSTDSINKSVASVIPQTRALAGTDSKFTFGSASSAPESVKAPFTSLATTTSFLPATTDSSAATNSLFNFGNKNPASSTTTSSTSTSGSGLFSFGTSSAAPATSVFTTGSTMSTASSSFGSGFFAAPKSSDGTSSTGILGAFGSSTTGKIGEGFKFGATSVTGMTPLFGNTFPAPSGELRKEGEGGGGGEDEEYVPPKPEVVEMKEEGSFYSIRCKLFYKKDDKFQERGIGFLHLKSCGEKGEKTQLVVRTDTALGNILLNIILNKNIPVGRQGTNNLTMMCVPNPPLDEKKPDTKTPVLMLIRVKTKEDADELLKQLNDCKAKC